MSKGLSVENKRADQLQGAPARLVLLPHEGHGYRARESVLHTLVSGRPMVSFHMLSSALTAASLAYVACDLHAYNQCNDDGSGIACLTVAFPRACPQYEQDQWLERHAGYGRLDEDYVASTGGTVSSTDSAGTMTE